jgi:hypothetical protein
VREGERYFAGFYASREEVEGHAYLRAEAGGDARKGGEEGREQRALAGERFCGGITGAAEDGASGESLDDAQPTVCAGGREGGDDDGMMFVEGGEEGSETGRRESEVCVGEQHGVGLELAGAQEAQAEGVALAAATTR